MNIISTEMFNRILNFLAEFTKWLYIGLFVLVIFTIIGLVIAGAVNISRFNKNRKNENIK